MGERYTTREEIAAVIHETCATLSAPFSAGLITFRFNRRYTATMGRATYSTRSIQFSSPLWAKATPQQRYQTIVHETCHLVAFALAGRVGRGHGWTWKRLMVRCGLNPHRCHAVEVVRRKQRGSLDVVCACPGKIHTLSTRRANRFRRGEARIRCLTCHTLVSVTPGTDAERSES